MVQAGEHPPSKHEALSSNPRTVKRSEYALCFMQSLLLLGMDNKELVGPFIRRLRPGSE
jgi:hypothetical protein